MMLGMRSGIDGQVRLASAGKDYSGWSEEKGIIVSGSLIDMGIEGTMEGAKEKAEEALRGWIEGLTNAFNGDSNE